MRVEGVVDIISLFNINLWQQINMANIQWSQISVTLLNVYDPNTDNSKDFWYDTSLMYQYQTLGWC